MTRALDLSVGAGGFVDDADVDALAFEGHGEGEADWACACDEDRVGHGRLSCEVTAVLGRDLWMSLDALDNRWPLTDEKLIHFVRPQKFPCFLMR